MTEQAAAQPLHVEIRADVGEREGEFIAEVDGRWVGELTVEHTPGALRLVHTGVVPAMRRRGIARMLVHAAADYARTRQMKVVPICTYAARVFADDPALHDLLASSRP